MDIQKRFGERIRAQMNAKKDANIRGFSEELGISSTALQEYLNGEGNPRLTTIEHIATKLGIDPALLLIDDLDLKRPDIFDAVFNNLKGVSELNNDDKLSFADHFREMIRLWCKEP